MALAACAGSHHWGRVLGGMGHRVRLIPPQYVKPFVKRSKNDRNGAEAISEAASRPTMRTVPVKTTDEQAATIIVKHQELMVNQRTQAINALRGHAAEFGIVGPSDDRDPRCQIRQQVCISMAITIAGAQAAQARGGSSGQQDGPDHLSHGGAWGGISASAGHCGLTRAPVPGVIKEQAGDGYRSNRRATKS